MGARVAQLVEHTLGKGEVIGSIPIASLRVSVMRRWLRAESAYDRKGHEGMTAECRMGFTGS